MASQSNVDLVSVGVVKAWEVNHKTETMGVCIPKMAKENLSIGRGTSFRVKIDLRSRQIILEPLKERSESRTKRTD